MLVRDNNVSARSCMARHIVVPFFDAKTEKPAFAGHATFFFELSILTCNTTTTHGSGVQTSTRGEYTLK